MMFVCRWEAVGCHDPPYTREEEEAIVEAKKNDPAAADEIIENLYLGNKAAAENTEFLLSRKISHVLNLAARDHYGVHPDKDALAHHNIVLKEAELRDKADEDISTVFQVKSDDEM